MREGALFWKSGSLNLYSFTKLGITQLFQNSHNQLVHMFLYHHVNNVYQNLNMNRNFVEKVVSYFFFHNKLFNTLRVIVIKKKLFFSALASKLNTGLINKG